MLRGDEYGTGSSAFQCRVGDGLAGCLGDRSGHGAGPEGTTGLSGTDDDAACGLLNRNEHRAALASVMTELLVHQRLEGKQVEKATRRRLR